MTTRNETREQRQARLDARVARLRADADEKEARAARIDGSVIQDRGFWTQPSYRNGSGRASSRARDRERSKLTKAAELYAEARELRATASALEAGGVRMAGDAAAEREAAIAAADFSVGQLVKTLYGVRKVVKVNAKSILIEGAFGPIRVEKHLAGEV